MSQKICNTFNKGLVIRICKNSTKSMRKRQAIQQENGQKACTLQKKRLPKSSCKTVPSFVRNQQKAKQNHNNTPFSPDYPKQASLAIASTDKDMEQNELAHTAAGNTNRRNDFREQRSTPRQGSRMSDLTIQHFHVRVCVLEKSCPYPSADINTRMFRMVLLIVTKH